MISFAFNHDDVELDYIPLPDIEFVKIMQDIGEGRRRRGKGPHNSNSNEQATTNIPCLTNISP